MRVAIVVAVACLSAVGLCAGDDAQASIRESTNIPAQELVPALKTLAYERGFQLVFRAAVVGTMRTHGAAGDLTTPEALTRLLEGTNLAYSYVDEKTVTILPVSSKKKLDGQGPAAGSSQPCSRLSRAKSDSSAAANQAGSGFTPRGWTGSGDAAVCVETHSRENPLLASAVAGAEVGPVDNSAAESSSNDESTLGVTLEQIVVSAQKRLEKESEVPAAISVLTGQQLELQQTNSLADIAGFVPGMAVQSSGTPGQRTLILNGLSTGNYEIDTPPLVATYVDDAPLGGSAPGGRASVYGLDLFPYDIERVEVLKGPQGTLYGSDAMGGIIKYVLRKPDLNQYEANVGADIGTIAHGGGLQSGERGILNVPLVPGELALRVSGFHQKVPGYIDNVGTGVQDANSWTQGGGRAALRWQASDRLVVDGTFLLQHIDAGDRDGVTVDGVTRRPIYGSYSRSTSVAEHFSQTTRFASLNVQWDLGFAALTSMSSWSEISSHPVQELPNFAPYAVLADPALTNAIVYQTFPVGAKKLTQEVRLASPDNQRIQWLVGAMYTKENTWEFEDAPILSSARTRTPYYLLLSDTRGRFREWAPFVTVTFKLNDRFDVSGGARYASNDSETCVPLSGGLFGLGHPVPCESRPYQGKTTWMAGSRFHLTQDAMLYARVATGYRPGGGCTGCGNPNLDLPDLYYPDHLTHYELGLKGDLLQHRLQGDIAVYYIDWSNIQLQTENALLLAYTGNGGTAVSKGVEFDGSAQLTDSLRINATLAYADAHLTEDVLGVGGPGTIAKSGDALPGTPRFMGSLIADYSRSLGGSKTLILGGSYRYRDSVFSEFASLPTPTPISPQNIVDVYAGVRAGSLTARITATNVFDNNSYTGMLYVTDPTRPMLAAVQPRTINLSLDYRIF